MPNSDDENDPEFITHLLGRQDPVPVYEQFFQLGDSFNEDPSVARMGVISSLIKARSLVMRAMLDPQFHEFRHRGDIRFPDVSPKTFRNLLKNIYGYNNIPILPIEKIVPFLELIRDLRIESLEGDAERRLVDLLSAHNVGVALERPYTLTIDAVKDKVTQILCNETLAVLRSPSFNRISPRTMRFIVKLNLEGFEADLWLAVIKWARRIVGIVPLPVNSVTSESEFILPCLDHMKTCTLSLITLVEDSRRENGEEIKAALSRYHQVGPAPSSCTLICTELGDRGIKHEKMYVKAVRSSSPLPGEISCTSSELEINTSNCCLELYAIICTAKKSVEPTGLDENTGPSELQETASYECCCTVKVSSHTGEDVELIREINFTSNIWYNEELLIPLRFHGEKLFLTQNKRYQVKLEFSCEHPVWFSSEVDGSCADEGEWSVTCGLVKETPSVYGTHAKYLLFRRVSS